MEEFRGLAFLFCERFSAALTFFVIFFLGERRNKAALGIHLNFDIKTFGD
jgi:hypothetical protein